MTEEDADELLDEALISQEGDVTQDSPKPDDPQKTFNKSMIQTIIGWIFLTLLIIGVVGFMINQARISNTYDFECRSEGFEKGTSYDGQYYCLKEGTLVRTTFIIQCIPFQQCTKTPITE